MNGLDAETKEKIREQMGPNIDDYDETRWERIKRWWYGCDHEFQDTGAEFHEQLSPKLNFEDELVIEKHHTKRQKCIICGEYRDRLEDIEEVKVCADE